MHSAFSEEQALIFSSAQSFADKTYPEVHRDASGWDLNGTTLPNWPQFQAMGWLHLGVPETYGGIGGTNADWLALASGLAKGIVTEPLFMTAALATTIFKYARVPVAREACEKVMSGEGRYAIACSEYDSRYDIFRVSTVAKSSGDRYILSGKKTLVFHASSANEILVSARTHGNPGDKDGIVLFSVPIDHAGVQCSHYRIMDGQTASDVLFDQVNVSKDRTLVEGADAVSALGDVFDLGAALLSADSMGQINYLLDATVEYLNDRKQFGVKLRSFQALQHQVADMYIRQQLAKGAFKTLVDFVDSESADVRQRAVSFAKSQIDKAARFIGQKAVQLHGGVGTMEESMVAQRFKRITANAHQFGDRDFHINRYVALAA